MPSADSLLFQLTGGASSSPVAYYLLITLCTIVGSLLGIFAKGYLTKRGENYATVADLKELRDKIKDDAIAVAEGQRVVKQRSDEEALLRSYQTEIASVLAETTPVLVRIIDRWDGKFISEYQLEWDDPSLHADILKPKKPVTDVFRLARWLSAVLLYEARTRSFERHPIDTAFRAYVRRIKALFATSGFGHPSLFWRDAIAEMQELCTVYSEKWKDHRPVSLAEFLDYLRDSGRRGVLTNEFGRAYTNLMRTPDERLAVFGIYLIDLVQDFQGSTRWEPQRLQLLDACCDFDTTRFWVWGKTESGQNDIDEYKRDRTRTPRNPDSVHFVDLRSVATGAGERWQVPVMRQGVQGDLE